ncbi:MAG: gliding motility-associated ABC transporter ATP-binding subunit GldA, partial [Bacteroidota bacterium]|nr:gliding motility-associated ABC transporter ATP-binding subunit GldA [Bacteroidota bacterium]
SDSVDLSLLQALANVDRVLSLQAHQYKIYTSQPDLVRKQLLTLAVAHNLNVVSLQTEGDSLEQVFRSLTTRN